jgi:hypothetical protein
LLYMGVKFCILPQGKMVEGFWNKVLKIFGTERKYYDEWVPCHHGMARPQVADGGSPPVTEGSCEYIE